MGRQLLLGREAVTDLESVLKSKDVTLLTKVHIVKAIVFLVVICGCQRCTMRKLTTEELMLLNCGAEEDT